MISIIPAIFRPVSIQPDPQSKRVVDREPAGEYFFGDCDIYSAAKKGDVPIALLYAYDGTVEKIFIREWYRSHPEPKLLAAILQWIVETGHTIAPGALNRC